MTRHIGSLFSAASATYVPSESSRKRRLYTPVSSSVTARLRAPSPHCTISETNSLVPRRRWVVMFSMRYMSFWAMAGMLAHDVAERACGRGRTACSSTAPGSWPSGGHRRRSTSPRRNLPARTGRSPVSRRPGSWMLTATAPSARMYRSLPWSPSWKRVSPAASSTVERCSATRAISSADRREKTPTVERSDGAFFIRVPRGRQLLHAGCGLLPRCAPPTCARRRGPRASSRPRRARDARRRPRCR